MLDRIEVFTLSATRWLALVACAFLLAIAMATFADVLARWLFAAPVHGLTDASVLGVAVACAAFLPALIARKGNIAISVLGTRLGGRWRRGLEAFGALGTLAFFGAMAWQYVRYAAEMARAGERTAILGWPVWPWWSAVAAMVIATALTSAVMVLLAAAGRSGGEEV